MVALEVKLTRKVPALPVVEDCSEGIPKVETIRFYSRLMATLGVVRLCSAGITRKSDKTTQQ